MNVLICDNNNTSCQSYAEQLEELARKNQIEIDLKAVSSTAELIFTIEDFNSRKRQVDLIYLEVEMPDMDGITTAKKLRSMGYDADIVFYTGSDKYAIAGYDVKALNYIVKNETSNEKIEEIFLEAVLLAKKRNTETLILSCAGEMRRIYISDISYFEVNNRIVTVHYNDLIFEFYSTLAKIEEQLFGRGFIRIHASYLVAKSQIVKMNSEIVVLKAGTHLPIGRSYKEAVMEYKRKKLST